MIVGNKVDLEKKDRAVSKDEGKALASSFGAAFLEVSVRFAYHFNTKSSDVFCLPFFTFSFLFFV